MSFTIEELTVMKMYDSKDRLVLIDDLIMACSHADDPEMAILLEKLIDKLEELEDGKFANIDYSDALG